MDPLNASLSHFRETRESPFSLTTTGLAISTDDPNLTKHHEEADSSIPTGKAPAMRICHLCGTPQLLKSFRCHASRCAQAWLQEEQQKPKSQQRPLPDGPEVPPGKPNPKTLEAVNRQAMRIWKEQSLETCPNCGRIPRASVRGTSRAATGPRTGPRRGSRAVHHVRRDDGVRGCGRVDGVWRHPAHRRESPRRVQDSPVIFRTGGDAGSARASAARRARATGRGAAPASRGAPSCRGRRPCVWIRSASRPNGRPDSGGGGGALTFHKTPAERARAERALRKAHKPKRRRRSQRLTPPPRRLHNLPKNRSAARGARAPPGGATGPSSRRASRLERRVGRDRNKKLKRKRRRRAAAAIRGAAVPVRRAATSSPRKSPSTRTCRRPAAAAARPPRLLDRAFRTSNSASLAWPDPVDLAPSVPDFSLMIHTFVPPRPSPAVAPMFDDGDGFVAKRIHRRRARTVTGLRYVRWTSEASNSSHLPQSCKYGVPWTLNVRIERPPRIFRARAHPQAKFTLTWALLSHCKQRTACEALMNRLHDRPDFTSNHTA